MIPFDFRCRFITHKGQSKRWRGRVGQHAVSIGEIAIPYDQILDTVTRPPRLAIQVDSSIDFSDLGLSVEDGVVVIVPQGVDAITLEREIDRRCSLVVAEARRKVLVDAGRADEIRFEVCPVCESEVDVTGFPVSAYVHCRYCDSLFRTDRGQFTDGAVFQHCTNCGMYDRVQRYTEFYFYFLVVIWGYRIQQRFLCDDCAKRSFFKTFAANFLFVLGLPASLGILLKLLRRRNEGFDGLPRANRLARGGRFREADQLYSEILTRVPEHPGVLTNMALGHMNGGDVTGAKIHLVRALTSCGHYPPAVKLLG